MAAALCISLLAGLLTLADGSGDLRWAHLRSLVFWQEESVAHLSTPYVPNHRAPEPPKKKAAEPQVVVVVPSAAGEIFQRPLAPAPARRAAPDPPTNSEPVAEHDVVRSTGRMVREVQKGIEKAIPGFSFDDAGVARHR